MKKRRRIGGRSSGDAALSALCSSLVGATEEASESTLAQQDSAPSLTLEFKGDQIQVINDAIAGAMWRFNAPNAEQAIVEMARDFLEREKAIQEVVDADAKA